MIDKWTNKSMGYSIRIFNKELMLDKSIIMEDVYLAIMKYNPWRIKFIYCDENSKQLIGRISINIRY